MKKGFTLIEMLIVVLIIAILAAIALPQYQMSAMRSRYSSLMELTKTMSEAVERYYLIQGVYTGDFNDLDITVSGVKEGQRVFLLDGTDQLWCYLGTSYIACANTSSLNNAYSIYFKKGLYPERQGACYSYGTTTDKYYKLCQKMAAASPIAAGGCALSSRGGTSSCYFAVFS